MLLPSMTSNSDVGKVRGRDHVMWLLRSWLILLRTFGRRQSESDFQ